MYKVLCYNCGSEITSPVTLYTCTVCRLTFIENEKLGRIDNATITDQRENLSAGLNQL